jgi:hypothetical protein
MIKVRNMFVDIYTNGSEMLYEDRLLRLEMRLGTATRIAGQLFSAEIINIEMRYCDW